MSEHAAISEHCPRCRTALRPETRAEGRLSLCSGCGGSAARLTVLQRRLAPDAGDALWNGAREAPEHAPLPCPSCSEGMKVTRVPALAGPRTIDLCPRCQLAWFDRGELEALALRSREPSPEQLATDARTALARLRMDEARDADLVEIDPFTARGAAGLADLPALLGDRGRERTPWLTWTLAGLILATFLLQWVLTGFELFFGGAYMGSNLERILQGWGLVPADPLRRGGLTLLTAGFLHLGVVHVLVNAWFLLLVGPPLEARLGPGRFLLVYVAALLGGALGVVLLRWGEREPSVGASGAVSGLLAACALWLPHLRLGFTVGGHRTQAETAYFQLRVGVRWVFAGWIVLQLLGLGEALARSTGARIAHGAHLGGAAAGAALWWFWLRHRTARGSA